MECKTVQEMLQAYRDGELAGEAMRNVEEHVLSCESCRNADRELKEVWSLLDVWDDLDVPVRFGKAVVSGIAGKRRMHWAKVALPAVAALAIILGVIMKFSGTEVREQRLLPVPAQSQLSAEYSDVNEEELIADLHILQDEEFYDSLEDLVRIEYLPLVDEPGQRDNDEERSSLDMILT